MLAMSVSWPLPCLKVLKPSIPRLICAGIKFVYNLGGGRLISANPQAAELQSV